MLDEKDDNNYDLGDKRQHILYKTYYKNVFLRIYYCVENKEISKDLTNDAFIKAFERYSDLKEKAKFNAWICKIALNLAKNYVKKNNKELLVDKIELFVEGEVCSAENEYFDAINEENKIHKIRYAVSSLDYKYKKIIYLRYWEKMSCGEIAAKLGLKLNTVYTRINRAKKKLNYLLEELGGQENE